MSVDGSWYILSLIERAQDRKKRAHEPLETSVPTLLIDSFVARHTKFSSAQEMIDESGFEVQSVEDFQAVPGEQWDVFIRNSSEFDSWYEMLQAIVAEYSKRELN